MRGWGSCVGVWGLHYRRLLSFEQPGTPPIEFSTRFRLLVIVITGNSSIFSMGKLLLLPIHKIRVFGLLMFELKGL